MKALTLTRPWPWAFLHTPKRCENCRWAPYREGKRLLEAGDWLAIHAGRQWDAAGAEQLREWGYDCPGPDSHRAGMIVAVVEFLGWVDTMKTYREGSRGHSLRAHLRQVGSSTFMVGPKVWIFGEEVIPITPGIPCRGQPGLWDLPPDVSGELAAVMRGGGPPPGSLF